MRVHPQKVDLISCHRAVSVTDYDELHPDSPSNTDVVAAAARAVATQSRLSADPTTNTNPGCIVKMKITASYLRYEAVNFDMALTFKRYIMDAVRVERVDDMVIVLFLPEASDDDAIAEGYLGQVFRLPSSAEVDLLYNTLSENLEESV
eukprot:m.45297 g.45297  ORF g.45297 m.45297 type:complete len:149 (+) comp15123_c0_seq3:2281-2727(+)